MSEQLRSRDAVRRLTRLPRAVVVIGVAIVLVGGLLAPGLAGAALLGVLAAFVAWLARLTWPVTEPGGRALRVLVVLILLAAAASKIT